MDAKELLLETYAHIPPARALEALSAEDAERRIEGAPHSIAEIVAHLQFWQDWFRRRCEGMNAPMVERAAAGWPEVIPGTWLRLREGFVSGLERLAALDSGALAMLASRRPSSFHRWRTIRSATLSSTSRPTTLIISARSSCFGS